MGPAERLNSHGTHIKLNGLITQMQFTQDIYLSAYKWTDARCCRKGHGRKASFVEHVLVGRIGETMRTNCPGEDKASALKESGSFVFGIGLGRRLAKKSLVRTNSLNERHAIHRRTMSL
ncbi:MAG: hypothetical protein OJF51_000626 [Nitrospira sp.]|nr:MAG: hypothetical protein OJF51_000626 [Nitrospira sp.]